MATPPATILLLDGFNLAFRSFFGIRELSRSDGFPTNAIHGWVKTLWKLEDLHPDALPVVCFDRGGDHEREALLPEYKQNRTEMPPDLRLQLPWIEKLTLQMGIPFHVRDGVEADDIIATLARRYRTAGSTVYIVSTDKDLAQCVTDGIFQLLPPPTANPRLGWRTLDPAGVEEKFGIPPTMIAEYLALIGDTSDNIPGLNGVGPKTAAKWLRANGSLDQILERCGTLTPKRFQNLVHESRDQLRRNLRLTQLNDTLDLEDIPDRRETSDLTNLLASFTELEMHQSAKEAQKRLETFAD